AVWDLGDQWFQWAGLPFVFAMWTARPGVDLADAAEALAAARDAGLANIQRIAEDEAAAVGLTPGECLRYFQESLHFTLGPAEREGLALFQRHAVRLGLAPADVHLQFEQSAATRI
ncbi:MAG: hypothetical protein KDA41_04650, partial [Planctomycetales bacterium]|nr:hypothetical protein [Planctomycetales bacterium]